MTSTRTAISLDTDLLERIDETARDLGLPRSRLLALAAENLIRQHESSKLLRQLNEAYGDQDAGDEEEISLRDGWRRRHRELLLRDP